MCAQAPQETQEESPNIKSLSVVIFESKPLPLIVKTNEPWISSHALTQRPQLIQLSKFIRIYACEVSFGIPLFCFGLL